MLAAAEHPCDHICCGNFGRMDFLLTAGQALRRPALMASARSCAAQVLDKTSSIDFRFSPLLAPGPLSPALFGGTAGIGYGVLRLARPDLVGSLLLFR